MVYYHAELAQTNRALIHKTGPSVRWVGAKPIVDGPGPCDYVGTLAGGRAVFFEAKTSSQPTGFTLPERSLHQLDFLRSALHLGAVAFYLVWWRRVDEVRVHGVRSLVRRIRRHEGTLAPDGWYGVYGEVM